MSFSKPFRLTPDTGNRLHQVRDLIANHNIRATHQGHDTVETSFSRSLAFLILTHNIANLGRADAGELSLDDAPSASEGLLSIPATTLRLQGESIRLAAQNLPIANLGLGDYAIVFEGYRALVGPTSDGRTTEPAEFTTVVDGVNKPTPTALYPAGCLDLQGGPSDAPLVTATVQTQKFEQWQYRVRLIADRDLAGYVSDFIPLVPKYAEVPDGEQIAGASYELVADGLYRALLPERPESYVRAYDRRLYACKLGVLRMGAAGGTVRTQGLADNQVWLGAPPALILASRRELAEQTALALGEHASRLAALENLRGWLNLKTNEAFAVADETLGGSTLSRCVPFPQAKGLLTGLRHDPLAAPAELQASQEMQLGISASVTFAAGVDGGVRGLRLLKNGLSTGFAQCIPNPAGYPASVNLSAQVQASPLDRFSLEVVQTSGSVLLVTESSLSVSRIG